LLNKSFLPQPSAEVSSGMIYMNKFGKRWIEEEHIWFELTEYWIDDYNQDYTKIKHFGTLTEALLYTDYRIKLLEQTYGFCYINICLVKNQYGWESKKAMTNDMFRIQ